MTEAVTIPDSIPESCSSAEAIHWRFLLALLLSAVAWVVIVPVSFPGAIDRWNEQAVPSNAPLFGASFAIYVLIARKGMLGCGKQSHRWLGWCLGIVPLAATVVWPWQSAEMAHYAFLLAMLVLMVVLGGWNWLRTFWPAGLFLLLCPGLPAFWTAPLIANLQQYGAWVTHQFCRVVLDTSYFREGIRIIRPTPFFQAGAARHIQIVVAEQCAGYKSLAGMAMLSLLYATGMRLTRRAKIAIVILGLTLPVTFNTVRLLLSASFIHYGVSELAAEVPHALLGHILMGIEATLLFLLARKWQLKAPQTPSAMNTTTSQNA